MGLTIRLIHHGDGDPAWNMAADEAILDAVESGISAPTVRFYRWNRAAISIGLHQNAERDLDLAACQEMNVPVVRRPSGGRGVLHGSDQTFSLVVPAAELVDGGRSVVHSYRRLTAALGAGLAGLGLRVEQGGEERRRAPSGDCFAVRSAADLVDDQGVKVAGSAQCRRAAVILQQTSIRHQPPNLDAKRLFRGRDLHAAYPLTAVAADELVRKIVGGITEYFSWIAAPGELCGWELERAGALMQARLRAGLHC